MTLEILEAVLIYLKNDRFNFLILQSPGWGEEIPFLQTSPFSFGTSVVSLRQEPDMWKEKTGLNRACDPTLVQ